MTTNTRGPRRSSECYRAAHNSCVKFNCTCSCHFGRPTQGNPANPTYRATNTTNNPVDSAVAAATVNGRIITKYDYPNIDWTNDTSMVCEFIAAQNSPTRFHGGGIQSHLDCNNKAYNRTGSCQCPCHTKGNQSVMPPQQSVHYRDAVARLAPIWDEIQEQVFLDIHVPMTFTGPGVRDAIWGGNIETLNIQCDDEWNNSDLFYTLWQKHLIKFGNYTLDGLNMTHSFTLDLVTGPITITIGSLFSSAWSFDRVSYSKSQGITVTNPTRQQVAVLEHKSPTAGDPTDLLKYGVEIATKYNLTLEQASIEWLANRIQALEPPPLVNETLVGFRAYSIAGGKLSGQHSVIWNSTILEVDCPDFIQHIKEVDTDWRMARQQGVSEGHQCGIYIHKDPATCLYEVPGQQAMALVWAEGVVGDFEKGYRAQKCTIKKLWIMKVDADGKDTSARLTDGVYDCPIIGPASPSDFLYDPEVMQFARRV